MHRSRVIPVFECIVPTFCQILKIAKALDFTAFQRFNRPIGRTSRLKRTYVKFNNSSSDIIINFYSFYPFLLIAVKVPMNAIAARK